MNDQVDSDQQGLLDPVVASLRAHLIAAAVGLGIVGEDSSSPTILAERPFKPLISVVVPVFNDERFVGEALESVRNQTYENWECLVVDDGSTDASWDVVRAAARKDSRIRPLRSRRNRGPAAARNRAIARAMGTHLAFLDGDDLMLPHSLEDRVAALSRHEGDTFVVGSFSGVRIGNEEAKIGDFPDRQPITLRPIMDFVTADGECPFTVIAPLLMTDVIRRVGGFDESMRSGAADWELWYRLLRNGYVFVSSPYVGAIYRQNGQGFVRRNPAAHTAVAARLIRAAYEPVDPSILTCPTPFPMGDPLPYYRSILRVAERATRFAAMALVDGKMDEMHATLAILEHGTLAVLERHLATANLVRAGAARALGVLPTELEGQSDVLEPFTRTVLETIRTTAAP